MNYEPSLMAVGLFICIVLAVLFISWFFARKSSSSKNFFAAGGTIHWGVNGIAFAGDYLSAASFLGICGMIATMGYDGFLYSIGYLAGWVVALCGSVFEMPGMTYATAGARKLELERDDDAFGGFVIKNLA